MEDLLPPYLFKKIQGLSEKEINVFQQEFYGSEVRQSCEKQVSLFLQHPSHLRMNFTTIAGKDYAHQISINNLNAAAKEFGCQPASKPQRGTLVVLGIGAGLHISKLLHTIAYSDVVIVEPNAEQFAMASKHVDLVQIKHECEKRGGSFSIVCTDSYESFTDAFKQLMMKIGCHLIVDISLYRHYSSPAFDRIFEYFKQWRNNFASMWGYLEDELMGLKHSLTNNQNTGIRNYNNLLGRFNDLNAVIVGNGPSLDRNIEHLKLIHNQAIVVSCGTSLSTLLKVGIIPDFHIEMERVPETYYLKENELNDPRLNNTTLITLSTVYPKLIECFKHRIVFAKGNDLGAEICGVTDCSLQPLYHCNPTVTNMAVAAFQRMGIKRLILLGCDYGYIDPSQHHSKLSGYFDQASDLSLAKFDAELKVQGNLRDYVYSSRVFNEARIAQERLIKLYPYLKVLNASDGAMIRGTETVTFENLSFEPVKKDEILHKVITYNNDIKNVGTISLGVVQDAVKHMQRLRHDIVEASSTVSILDVINQFVFTLCSNQNDKISKLLLSGTLKYIVATISSHINHLNPSSWLGYEHVVRKELDSMCELVIAKLSLQSNVN
ncbi:hypothetical protein S4054249_21005 [Pseudoalteromonas luteoviolacea]|uniref:DUF115 domain-containing protein n=1 Tax=Pseudoalteromonas luteoviolacea S4054 TaxID=1129367 RepID=A0A0F6AEM1_9GAMM|nr:hypothetical protein S4054249_21005 [Pseudoalteromonas luteoviolacea]AOT15571.1 hypothetical protein S40542_22585 [Pseudoalteromonas luteoviolacea]AOT20178.1 hypothetical protein S4054_20920 [Pseudoalteromonas luteoviolacea]KKE84623.1 hypothetical protein N479_08640 [Pseudoalteromonas luteoviolacea S4054]KZN71232.1 hypothetical protein N481_18780 [Pseudoalteromonas luteoviolacea S4047-1]